MTASLIDSIAELREQDALTIVKKRLDAGEDPFSILNDTRTAMQTIGQRFEDGEYFIPELVYAGEIMNEIGELVKPKLAKEVAAKKVGRVVIGTVQGDIHDIGKNIVTFMLDINGFEVHDLGVDVSPAAFVAKIQEVKPEVVGLSAFLTGCFESMKRTVEAISAAGLRSRVKIMIGGNYINDQVCDHVGADGWGKDAGAAVRLARLWIGGK